MNPNVKDLRGSTLCDHFKYLHKNQLPSHCYALTVDLELVEKNPFPFVVARVNFTNTFGLTFTQALAAQLFNDLPIPFRIPSYQVIAENFLLDTPTEEHRFSVYQIREADYKPNPPTYKMDRVFRNGNWDDLETWELELRERRKRAVLNINGKEVAEHLINLMDEVDFESFLYQIKKWEKKRGQLS